MDTLKGRRNEKQVRSYELIWWGVFCKSAQLDGAGLQVEQWGAAPAGDGDWHMVRKCTMAG